eukprot:4420655-Amphidinium_carterae.1
MCICFPTKAEALLHEGTLPASASRLTMADITTSFGHGLRGVLPSVSGTMILLSLWENGLEGQIRPSCTDATWTPEVSARPTALASVSAL